MKMIKIKNILPACFSVAFLTSVSLASIVFFTSPLFARDFIVNFMEENYKETQAQFSDVPLIYHSIQVSSDIGPKLLILTGNDYNYRKWLRYYIATNKKFITRVPDDQVDNFISSKAYEIDVTALHPVNLKKWKAIEKKTYDANAISGSNHILIIDSNEKRTNLIQTIAKNMGYPTTIFKSGIQALQSFRLQPEKFSMIIVNHTIQKISLDDFVNKALKLSHTIPIIIDTGYNDQERKNRFISKFSDSGTVHIKSMILKNLQKTINKLINQNA